MTTRRNFINVSSQTVLALSMGLSLAGATLPSHAQPAPVSLLNVSYDPTRERYVEHNAAFAKHCKAKTGQDVSFKQSYGGSGKQARSTIDGLGAFAEHPGRARS